SIFSAQPILPSLEPGWEIRELSVECGRLPALLWRPGERSQERPASVRSVLPGGGDIPVRLNRSQHNDCDEKVSRFSVLVSARRLRRGTLRCRRSPSPGGQARPRRAFLPRLPELAARGLRADREPGRPPGFGL